jgi:hypothetical protein
VITSDWRPILLLKGQTNHSRDCCRLFTATSPEPTTKVPDDNGTADTIAGIANDMSKNPTTQQGTDALPELIQQNHCLSEVQSPSSLREGYIEVSIRSKVHNISQQRRDQAQVGEYREPLQDICKKLLNILSLLEQSQKLCRQVWPLGIA